MKKAVITFFLVGVGFSAYAYYSMRTVEFIPEVTIVTASRGVIADTVGATGTLEAVTTVQVGSQVSGIIQNLSADFNSIVREGEVIARLDPSLFQTQIEQARANLVRAQADVERQRVSVDDAKTKFARAEGLAARNLIPQTELEAAIVAVRTAEAQIKSSEAQVTQAEASLNQTEVNLQHTIITAPIDGIVISRAVDVGQTVAASMSAPELFVLAADLTKMRVIANIDEADVGRIRPGQLVTFTVDAYAAQEFEGTVSQIRLDPIVLQNVVTYATVIDVPNPDLTLKPGMTATVTLEIARRDDVVRIPNTALRFRPTPQMFAALNQPVPEELQGGRGGRGGNAAAVVDAASGARAQGAPGGFGGGAPGQGRGPGGGGFGGGDIDPEQLRQMVERTQNMPPEERERMRQQFGGGDGRGGGDGGRSGQGGPGGERRRQAAANQGPTIPAVERGARTIDALFAPLPPTTSTGRLWLFDGVALQPMQVGLGITDGSFSELLSGDIASGAELVTGVTIGDEGPGRPAGGGAVSSPLIPQMRFGRGRR